MPILYLLFKMASNIITLYKSAYGGLSSGTWWLSLVMVVNRMGTMVIPFMTMYLTQQNGLSIDKAGLVMSIFGLGAVTGAMIGGKLVDVIGYYYVQITALAGGGVLFIVLGQMEDYTSICITTFFLATLNESFRPANTVAIAHYSKEENRTRSYSLNRLAINLGWAMGGALGGTLASFDYTLLFWVDGLSNIFAALLMYLTLSPKRNSGSVFKPRESTLPAPSVFHDKVYLLFIVLVFFFALCFFQMFTTLPVYLKDHFHLSVFYIGMIMAANGLIIAFVEMIIVFKLEGKRSSLQYIAGGMLLVGISFLLLNFTLIDAAIIAMISMVFLTFGEIFTMPFMNSWWIGRAQIFNRGAYAALFSVAWAAAQAIGPYSGSLIAEHAGFDFLWYLVGGICFILAIAYFRLQKLK